MRRAILLRRLTAGVSARDLLALNILKSTYRMCLRLRLA
jgi:hypothetical protein